LNTAISDSGAIPFPTEITSPITPFLAILSSVGVFAASSGVFPSKSGLKERKSYEHQNYPIPSPVMQDQMLYFKSCNKSCDQNKLFEKYFCFSKILFLIIVLFS